MYIAYIYVDTVLGVFETEELANQALSDYHGEGWQTFGHTQYHKLNHNSEGKLYGPVAPIAGLLPATVTRLPLSTTYTPQQALQAAEHDQHLLESLIIVGQYFPVDGKAPLFVIPSRMDLKLALWIHRRLGLYIDDNA